MYLVMLQMTKVQLNDHDLNGELEVNFNLNQTD